MCTQEKTYNVENENIAASQLCVIVLHNDDINTFNHVIDTLIAVCQHDACQAEQCAIITHFKGKCEVKHGEFQHLRPIKDMLLQSGLSATISCQ